MPNKPLPGTRGRGRGRGEEAGGDKPGDDGRGGKSVAIAQERSIT